MEIIIYVLAEAIYYTFIGYLVTKFNNIYLANSCILLFLFSMLISLPCLISIKILNNEKKHFLISSIWIIFSSLLIFIFRRFTTNGIINFAFHLYSILFMLVPFLCLFILSIYKLCIPTKKKKQLVALIVSKKIIIILFGFIFSFFCKFENLIICISIIDFILNITSPFISNFLLKYLN